MFCSSVSETAGLRSIVALPGRVHSSSSTFSRHIPRGRSAHSVHCTTLIDQSSLLKVCVKRQGVTVRRGDQQQHSVSTSSSRVIRCQASRWVFLFLDVYVIFYCIDWLRMYACVEQIW
jgi:hypothetical protein